MSDLKKDAIEDPVEAFRKLCLAASAATKLYRAVAEHPKQFVMLRNVGDEQHSVLLGPSNVLTDEEADAMGMCRVRWPLGENNDQTKR